MFVFINLQWCKGCGICIAFCPKQALRPGPEGKAEWIGESCIGCGLCERYCPDLAIEVQAKPSGEKS